ELGGAGTPAAGRGAPGTAEAVRVVSTALLPAWIREVEFSLALHPQILLTGNVRDLYPLPSLDPTPPPGPDPAPGLRYVPIGAVLWQVCQARGFAALATLDPVTSRLSVRPGGVSPPEVLRPFVGGRLSLDQISGLLEATVAHEGPPVGLLFPY